WVDGGGWCVLPTWSRSGPDGTLERPDRHAPVRKEGRMLPCQTQFDLYSFDVPPDLVNALLARGWEDASWHHDACPSFSLGQGVGVSLRLWVDAADPAARESEGLRFTLCREEGGSHAATLWQTDELNEALARLLEL